MNKIGVMIRKTGDQYPPSKHNLNKQMKTLHKKLKKVGVYETQIAIEKDKGGNYYHTHLILSIKENEIPVYDKLSDYIKGFNIKGSIWNKILRGVEYYDECVGKYGIINAQPIRNEIDYRRYINKFGELLTLI